MKKGIVLIVVLGAVLLVLAYQSGFLMAVLGYYGGVAEETVSSVVSDEPAYRYMELPVEYSQCGGSIKYYTAMPGNREQDDGEYFSVREVYESFFGLPFARYRAEIHLPLDQVCMRGGPFKFIGYNP